MSYILKALKKSEQERARGTVPKLAAARADDGEERSRIWPMVATAALSVNALVVALILWQPGTLFWESGVAEAEVAPALSSPTVGSARVAGPSPSEAAMPAPGARDQEVEPVAAQVQPEPRAQPAETQVPAAEARVTAPTRLDPPAQPIPEQTPVVAQADGLVETAPDLSAAKSETDETVTHAAQPAPAAVPNAEAPGEPSAGARTQIAALPPSAVEREPVVAARDVADVPVPRRKPAALPTPVVVASALPPLTSRAAETSGAEQTQLARAVVEPEPAPDDDTGTALYQGLPELWQMPPAFRAGVPKLNISVHVYAPQPASRFVIIDRKKYWEGDELNNGLLIEAIVPEGLVIDYQGRQFKVGSR